MGYGDEIMASFVVSEVGERFPDKKVAISKPNSFPELRRWDRQQAQVYENNPYLINPKRFKHIDPSDIIYYPDWRGHRPRCFGKSKFFRSIVSQNPEVFSDLDEKYYTDEDGSKRFRAYPGSIFFTEDEKAQIKKIRDVYYDHVLIMPQSPCVEKNWGLDKWMSLIKTSGRNYKFLHAGRTPVLEGVEFFLTQSFRDFLMLASAVRALLTTAGGAHHSAAALNTPAMVLFGGNCGRDHMAYEDHLNISIDLKDDPCCCRSGSNCAYCIQCWQKLTPSIVYETFLRFIEGDRKDLRLKE